LGLALLLVYWPLAAQPEPQLNSADSAGNFYSAMNFFNGTFEYIQVRKISSNGSLLWTQNSRFTANQRAGAVAIDPSGGIAVAAVRRDDDRRVLVLLHYTSQGLCDWERSYNDSADNIPTAAISDQTGNIYVAGNTTRGGNKVARLWKYDALGSFAWMREYDNGSGNTYARQLQIDTASNAVLSVESFQSQTATSGQYALRLLVFDKDGYQVSVQ